MVISINLFIMPYTKQPDKTQYKTYPAPSNLKAKLPLIWLA